MKTLSHVSDEEAMEISRRVVARLNRFGHAKILFSDGLYPETLYPLRFISYSVLREDRPGVIIVAPGASIEIWGQNISALDLHLAGFGPILSDALERVIKAQSLRLRTHKEDKK